MGKASRDKGGRGEREIRDILRAAGYLDAERGSQRSGSPDSPDVRCDSLPDIHWEVKRTESLALWPAVQQAADDCGQKVPVVVHRPSGREWIAILPLDRFLETFITKVYPPNAPQEERQARVPQEAPADIAGERDVHPVPQGDLRRWSEHLPQVLREAADAIERLVHGGKV